MGGPALATPLQALPQSVTLPYLLAVLVSIVVGFGIGYHAGLNEWGQEVSDFRFALAIAISCVWVASVIAGIVNPDYSTSFGVHAIMGASVGWLFGIDNPIG